MGRRVVAGRLATELTRMHAGVRRRLHRGALRAAGAAVGLVAAAGTTAPASAQTALTGRVRLLGGYTYEQPERLGSAHDVWLGAIPELSLLVDEPRWLLRASYAPTAALHTRNPNELAQRLTFVASHELSRRTTLLLNAEANQSTLSNYLLTRPVGSTPVTLVPLTLTNVLTATAGQGLAWEASPRVLVGQSATATFVTSLDREAPLTSFFASLGGTVERLWKVDAVGAELRAGYAQMDAPPLPEQKLVTLTGAPRWRHDYSESWSTLLSAGATLVVRPGEGQPPIVAPFGLASILYGVETTTADLTYAGGIQPSLLTGQLLNAHQVTLRGSTMLSERHGVLATGSVGVMRATFVVLDDATPPPPDFDALLSDFDISWLASDHVQLFGRYQFFRQYGGLGASFMREAIIAGVTLSTRAPDGVRVPTRFPQRVDRSDGAPRR